MREGERVKFHAYNVIMFNVILLDIYFFNLVTKLFRSLYRIDYSCKFLQNSKII